MDDHISRKAVELRINEFIMNKSYTEEMLREEIHNLPSVEQTLYGYDIADLVFIVAIMRKERISPTELRAILYDVERMSRIVITDITNQARREFERQMRTDMPMGDM